jgi:transcriptional regulator with XRE-family HTH domain
MRGKDARTKFVDSHLKKGIAFQVQALRGREKWTQEQLATKLGSNQNAVYRLENPNYGKQTITTLRKVAAVFDVALVVRFVPFSQLVDWVNGTPHLDRGLSPRALEVPDFESELGSGVLEGEQKAVSPSTDEVIDVEIFEPHPAAQESKSDPPTLIQTTATQEQRGIPTPLFLMPGQTYQQSVSAGVPI